MSKRILYLLPQSRWVDVAQVTKDNPDHRVFTVPGFFEFLSTAYPQNWEISNKDPYQFLERMITQRVINASYRAVQPLYTKEMTPDERKLCTMVDGVIEALPDRA